MTTQFEAELADGDTAIRYLNQHIGKAGLAMPNGLDLNPIPGLEKQAAEYRAWLMEDPMRWAIVTKHIPPEAIPDSEEHATDCPRGGYYYKLRWSKSLNWYCGGCNATRDPFAGITNNEEADHG